MSGDMIKLAYLPIYMTQSLYLTPWAIGATISLQPLLELVTMPIAGILADKVGNARVISLGLLIGMLGYLVIGISSVAWHLYLAQALLAILVGVVLGLGISYVQRLSPDSSGLATSIYFGGLSLSATIGGYLVDTASPS